MSNGWKNVWHGAPLFTILDSLELTPTFMINLASDSIAASHGARKIPLVEPQLVHKSLSFRLTNIFSQVEAENVIPPITTRRVHDNCIHHIFTSCVYYSLSNTAAQTCYSRLFLVYSYPPIPIGATRYIVSVSFYIHGHARARDCDLSAQGCSASEATSCDHH